MSYYTYMFVWKDASNTYQKKYLDAPNVEVAKIDFEATFKVDIVANKVKISRIH